MMAEAKQRQPGQDAGRRTLMPLVLLVLTAGVVALTIRVLVRKDRPPGPELAPSSARPAQAEQVLARARGLIDAGDRRMGTAAPTGGRVDPATIRWARLAYRGARDLARSYVRAHPGDVEVRPVLAEALCRLGECRQAEQVVDHVLRRAPRSAAALWAKGQIRRRRGDEDYAKWLRAAAESPAADAQIWARYGVWLAIEGRDDEAEDYLRRARNAGSADASVLSMLGRIAFRKDRFQQAERLLEQATKGDAPRPDDLALLAEARMNLGKPDQAARAADMALKLTKGDDEGRLLMLMGRVRIQQRRPLEAARAFEAAAKYRLLRGEAAFQAAKCYYFADKYALAMKYIDLAAEIRPGDELVHKWVRKIEDARFGPRRSETGPAIVPPPFGRAAQHGGHQPPSHSR